ncbi:ribose 5-phosphate isomerase A [Mucilaginibacter myungsuensis]|uniref:Ribose 5-phosphate isomerase A n=1 Tax=Mucilaginibacter myungsuensis TaxID=649104 RepID=A0A929KXZ2_9SPHI|nr:ribose 5-phosphate isomerase A [Mucilaginibacter myungsuensis]MBE9663731.1 ribose 5-phosphate isomerase A [Mucilaginibacter myungsuensis]MDN3598945.1 ribose 5-phosphate isomerase A [Mucilaginibacter myungsuensis]
MMTDYKLQAAERAIQLIAPGQTIGLGDGSAVLHLADLVAADSSLRTGLTLTTSSARTAERLVAHGLTVRPLADLSELDIYFDGCDQFDRELNAIKSGSGIHTHEKIAAAMAGEFILIGDESKFAEQLGNLYPVVLEVVPFALRSVQARLSTAFSGVIFKQRLEAGKHTPVITTQGNYLLEMSFNVLPELEDMDIYLKMLPAVLNHSLFYHLATSAVIAGPEGTTVLRPARRSV